MAFFKFHNIKISGIAAAVPENILKTESFKPIFGEEEVDKFVNMVGVKETHRTSEHQTASDLGYAAARLLLEKKEVDPSEIGAVVFSSHSPDYRRPSTAFILQHRLGVGRDAVVFDISLGCSSLVYGMQTICSMMNSSDINKALLFVGDTAGKSVYPEDRSSCMLFGEAGAVMLLEKTEEESNIEFLLRSDGSGYKYMIIPGGGYRNLHASEDVVQCHDGNPRTLMNSFIQGTSVFTFTIFDVPRVLKDFWARTGTTVDDYDVFAFHQANLYILRQIAKKTQIPMERLPISLDRYGNTSGASAIVTLCDKYGENTECRTLRTLACGFGIGLSWGVASFNIDTCDIYPIIIDGTIFEEGLITNPNQLYSNI